MKKTKKQHKRQYGFTLIELLVVISIIGFMASIVGTQVRVARFKARDAARLQIVQNLTNALALYYNDNNKFPCHTLSLSNESNNFLQPLVTAGYLKSNPTDPDNAVAPLEYVSFKMKRGAACGQIAHFGIYLENATSCPANSMADPGDHSVPNPLGGYYLHCHFFFPQPLPPPCTNPFWLTELSWPTSCSRLIDTKNDY